MLVCALLHCPALSEVDRPGGNKLNVFMLCAKVTGKQCASAEEERFCFQPVKYFSEGRTEQYVCLYTLPFTSRKPSEQ